MEAAAKESEAYSSLLFRFASHQSVTDFQFYPCLSIEHADNRQEQKPHYFAFVSCFLPASHFLFQFSGYSCIHQIFVLELLTQ
ncbi:unnamed protein product [Citrullus colocynthis]|uniref:Uncharacterized protein n=1 Tax=Citrullus colocynthis TaxID=252529 RepID=A0ABP0Y9T6_9ROSI